MNFTHQNDNKIYRERKHIKILYKGRVINCFSLSYRLCFRTQFMIECYLNLFQLYKVNESMNICDTLLFYPFVFELWVSSTTVKLLTFDELWIHNKPINCAVMSVESISFISLHMKFSHYLGGLVNSVQSVYDDASINTHKRLFLIQFRNKVFSCSFYVWEKRLRILKKKSFKILFENTKFENISVEVKINKIWNSNCSKLYVFLRS